jgi:acyl carrier protein
MRIQAWGARAMGIYLHPLHAQLGANMAKPSFVQFANFVRAQCGISAKKNITPESKFEDDLGITGDDGYDLLKATEKHFDVRLSDALHEYSRTFDLDQAKFSFKARAYSTTTARSESSPVGDLYRAVQNAKEVSA